MRKAHALHLFAGVAVVTAVNAAHAQTNTSTEMAPQSGAEVGDIIVTAQRRGESIQNVPVAVTAVSEEALADARIENVIDLKISAPSLNSVVSNGIYLANSIRGVGSLGYGASIESPIALYVDNVYQAAPFLFSVQLNNVQSVEVLKGPQGTLFGRNATGGLVHIKTKTPSGPATGKFSLSYGNYDTWSGETYLGGSLTDTLAADLSFTGKMQGEGFGINITTGEDTNKLDHNYSLRSKWVWAPGPETTVTAIGNYFDGAGSAGIGAAYPGKISPNLPGRIAPDLGYGVDTDARFERTVEGGGGSLQIEQGLGGVKLTSITAYQKSDYFLAQDIDFTPADLAKLAYRQIDDQFSQELQLASDNSSSFKWTVGGFYFDTKSKVRPSDADLSNQIGLGFRINGLLKTKSGALYGQGSYELAPSTNLTLGARYTSERREEVGVTQEIYIPSGFVVNTINYPDRSVTTNKFSWRASLDHRFSPELMAYVSFNTGFKSGGFNSLVPGAPPYLPEELTAYEAGIKSDLFDRRLRFNLSGFYYDYQDIQVQALAPVSGLLVINGPKAEIYGLDADFSAVLTEGLNLSGGMTWISPKFGDYRGCLVSSPAGGVPLISTGTQCRGNQLPLAAKFTFSGALNYEARLGGGMISANGNVYYNSGYYFEPDNVLKQRRYALLGASLKWTSDIGLSVGVWGKNLSNRRIAGYAATQQNGNAVWNLAEPRTYGVTVGFEF